MFVVRHVSGAAGLGKRDHGQLEHARSHRQDALKGGGFDAVLFTSSSTVRNLVGIAGKPHDSTILACIGPQTAQTAQELGLRVDVLAERPDIVTLVDALADHALARRAAGLELPGAARRKRVARAAART